MCGACLRRLSSRCVEGAPCGSEIPGAFPRAGEEAVIHLQHQRGEALAVNLVVDAAPVGVHEAPRPGEAVRGKAPVGGLGAEGGITEGPVVSLPDVTAAVHGRLHPVVMLVEVGGSVGGINPAEPRAENGYFFEDNSAYAISLYNVWIGSISGDLFFTTIFYFILPLAATLPFSFSLSDESKSGYLRQMTLKKGQMRYYFAKYIVTFTSGFLLAAIPLLINVIITACYIPAYKPDPLEQLYLSLIHI